MATAVERLDFWVDGSGGVPEGDLVWYTVLEEFAKRIDALEAAQQPALVKPTGPLDQSVYPDRMSDVLLDAATGQECKAIPVKDYEAALEELRTLWSTLQADAMLNYLGDVRHIIRLLTGEAT